MTTASAGTDDWLQHCRLLDTDEQTLSQNGVFSNAFAGKVEFYLLDVHLRHTWLGCVYCS